MREEDNTSNVTIGVKQSIGFVTEFTSVGACGLVDRVLSLR